MDKKNKKDEILNKSDFKRTGSDKANQLGPSSPYERSSSHPQADASASSADNDMDRQTTMQDNLQEDADEAQSDGSLSFPEGK
jgi:hypothetical protein